MKRLILIGCLCLSFVAYGKDWPERQNLLGVAGGGGGGTPGGADKQVQFNDAGVFAGSAFLLFDKTTGQLLMKAGTVALPAYSFSADPDTGIYRVGPNDMAFVVGGTAALSIDGDVNVTNTLNVPSDIAVGSATTDGIINIIPTAAQVTNAGLDIQAPDDYGVADVVLRAGDTANPNMLRLIGDSTLKVTTNIKTSNFLNSGIKWGLLQGTGGLQLSSDSPISWSSTTAYTGAKDTGIERDSAGVLEVTDGSTGTGQLITRLHTIAGITASVTQTQGNGPLTATLNEVSTVANVNDTVTLPTAAAGAEAYIANNGANTLQIFPASGDDLGAGVDTATTLASGSNIHFIAYDVTNWETF